jgi:argininosuccinate lyase
MDNIRSGGKKVSYQQKIVEKEGTCFPGRTYEETVLAPAHEEAKNHLFRPMMSANKAQLIMLVEQGLVKQSDADHIMKALLNVTEESIQQSTYTGEFEDLFFQVEHLLLKKAGDIAGNLHLARSRNDMGVAMYRMAIREKLLTAIKSLVTLQEHLIETADVHKNTVMLAYTHTQQAQPTTMAHYLMAMHDSLERDYRRLVAAYANVNCSPLGAAAITTSGFPVNRHRMAELLAFDGLVENSYDAIAGGDYLGETALALQMSFVSLGRYMNDFLQWSTQEFGAITVADPYVQISSIMPQKRNPVSFEHIRSLASSVVGLTGTVVTMLHNTPFGDIVDTEDDMQPHLWKALTMADQLYRLTAVVIGTMTVNADILLNRARESYATVTELADTLVRECDISFRQAHSVAYRVVKSAIEKKIRVDQIDSMLVLAAAEAALNKSLNVTDAMISRALDPINFVKVRSLPGGPAPSEVDRMIRERRCMLSAHVQWIANTQIHVLKSMEWLDETANKWGKQDQ